MKQLVILSGKGGTGKTSLAAAFAHLAHAGPVPLPVVLADADVDAANLELVLQPRRLETHDFTGGAMAAIDPERCQGCGTCERVCRFEAVLVAGDGFLRQIDPIACEGCAACVYQCPEEAIRMEPQVVGEWSRSESRYGPLFHAELRPAQENSGKLVTLVKQQARLLAMDEDLPALIVDGPPGIGCPVISAAAGADLALVVTEPTAAGLHDMQRAVEMAAHFRLPVQVVVNKADLYPEGSAAIEAACAERGLALIGQIPFDPAVGAAMMQGQPVTAYRPDSPASRAIAEIWQRLRPALMEGDSHA
ncbi:MAG: ATP-binding protein [Anaerolineales bacterium]|nr:ATP-binding protein [Anaerolineales bacterium]